MAQKPMLVLGMMSGTSADGIDTALVKIFRFTTGRGAPPNLKINLVNHTHQSFPRKIRKEILRVAGTKIPSLRQNFSQLHARLGHIYADAALAACKKFHVSPKNIDLIGNHGQTTFHQGVPTNFLGAKTASDSPNRRRLHHCQSHRHINGLRLPPRRHRLGGKGAPLVPFADYALYRGQEPRPRLPQHRRHRQHHCHPANAKPSDVFAFDTGPGNMLIDALVQHFTDGRQRYDKDARLARNGKLIPQILATLMKDPYLQTPPPKSTGREYFGAAYVKKLLTLGRRCNAKPNDSHSHRHHLHRSLHRRRSPSLRPAQSKN